MLIEMGGRNVYADLGIPDADAMQRKATLVTRIGELMKAKAFAPARAAALLGIDTALLERWLCGQFRDADESVLLESLQRLEIELAT